MSVITSLGHFFISAKNLLLGMLKVDPAYRRTAKEILNHPWITVSNHKPQLTVAVKLCI